MKIQLVCLIMTMAQAPLALAQEDDLSDLSAEERAFFEDDSFFQSLEVSRGTLNWVEPDKTLEQYALENRISLRPTSHQDGVVIFEQCHRHLDAISKIEVVYNDQTTSDLVVISTDKIQQAQAKDASVELIGVEKGAQVCIKGKSQTLTHDGQQWQLKRGPYMRKFLDGYYPMHLTEVIDWQDSPLKLVGQPRAPLPVPSKFIQQINPHSMQFDYYFAGRLELTYQFEQEE